jgi:hypothetical protein
MSNLEKFYPVSWSHLKKPEEHKSEDIAVEHVKNEMQEKGCSNKTGEGWSKQCGNGFRWRYVFFIISLSGVFATATFVSLTIW